VPVLLLIRHGATDWNEAHRWQGQDDQPLNARGHAQAQGAATVLAAERIAAIYTSDLARARATAAYLTALIDAPLHERADLREIDTGSWTGLDRAGASAVDPIGLARYEAGGDGWSGGETYRQLQARAVAAATAIVAAAAPHDTVAVFTHGGVIRALVAHTLGGGHLEARLNVAPTANVALTRIGANRLPWRLERYNQQLD
jgi:probable phosphoglycerate mutase